MREPTTSRAGWRELRQNRLLSGLLVAYGLVWALTAIRPSNRQDWLLENLLVFAVLTALVWLHRCRALSNASYVLLFVFLVLHAIGAHYTYSEMPIGNWLRDHFQLSRNHYDRLVHFMFGLLLSHPTWEVLRRSLGVRRGWARVGAVHVIMAWSALYEIIEATVAQVVSPELGAAYNGIQGDVWDAQKDAALAMAGAILTMTVGALWPVRTGAAGTGKFP